jgi:hypothetical protein
MILAFIQSFRSTFYPMSKQEAKRRQTEEEEEKTNVCKKN